MINKQLLREKMDKKGYSISKLACHSGIDKSIISRIFSEDDYKCTIGTAQKIARTLKLTSKESTSIFFSKSCGRTTRKDSQ